MTTARVKSRKLASMVIPAEDAAACPVGARKAGNPIEEAGNATLRDSLEGDMDADRFAPAEAALTQTAAVISMR